MLGLGLGDRRRHALGGQAAPDRRQLLQRRAVAVELGHARRARVGEAVGAGEGAVEIVEAAVLGKDHDDVLDLVEAGRRDARLPGQEAQQGAGEQAGQDALGQHVSSRKDNATIGGSKIDARVTV